MKKIFGKSAIALGALAIVAGSAMAAGHIGEAVKARQALMKGYGAQMGVLGGMAQGKIDYDAAKASEAAAALLALVQSDQSGMWPEGSDNFELGADVTRAVPAIWENLPDVGAKASDLAAAAAAMNAAAGTDLAALQGAIGGVGRACGACHQPYRAPKP